MTAWPPVEISLALPLSKLQHAESPRWCDGRLFYRGGTHAAYVDNSAPNGRPARGCVGGGGAWRLAGAGDSDRSGAALLERQG